MQINADLTALPDTLTVSDTEDFTAFAVQINVPEHVWVDPQTLIALAGHGDVSAWRTKLQARVASAATKGWVDERGWIRAHTRFNPPAPASAGGL